MAFKGIAAEEEGLGATLGGAGACFFVPKSTSPVHVISFVYTLKIYTRLWTWDYLSEIVQKQEQTH